MLKDGFGNREVAALWLRTGLGLVFIIGGISKLSLLLNESTQAGMIANYMGTSGYINALFQDFLFTGLLGQVLTPFNFLTALSAFELISGIMLFAGFLVRPLALFYGLLLWSFVVSLPTMTVPGVEIGVKTYESPAIFVQIRDIALSGMMFVLFNLGAGANSIDRKLLPGHQSAISWDHLGLLLRFSVGSIFIVAGFFGNYAKIQSFGIYTPLLAITGLLLIFGNAQVVRICGALVVAFMLWFMVNKLNFDKGIIANLNGFKREFAIAGAGGVLVMLAGGKLFTVGDIVERSKAYLRIATRQQVIGPKAEQV